VYRRAAYSSHHNFFELGTLAIIGEGLQSITDDIMWLKCGSSYSYLLPGQFYNNLVTGRASLEKLRKGLVESENHAAHNY